MTTLLPKRELVSILLRTGNEELIRTALRIHANTRLDARLYDFSKDELLECIRECGPDAVEVLRRREQDYPLRGTPSAYLICMDHVPNWEDLRVRAHQLQHAGRAAATEFPDDRPVRRVYMATDATNLLGNPNLFELQIAYEIKVDYVEPDPASPHHGELVSVLSLERALVWIPPAPFQHALMICPDFVATRPVREYLTRLGVVCHSPNLTEKMLLQISNGARPRTASFIRRATGGRGPFDTSTVMLADSDLGASTTFQTLRNDRAREQTSGVFSNHPSLTNGGLGVARQQSKIVRRWCAWPGASSRESKRQ